jgi:hypothetical protein
VFVGVYVPFLLRIDGVDLPKARGLVEVVLDSIERFDQAQVAYNTSQMRSSRPGTDTRDQVESEHFVD